MRIDYNTPVSANYALNMLGKPYDVALQHFRRAHKEVVNGDTGIIYQIGSSIAHIATGAFELIPCVNIVILYVDRFFNNRYEYSNVDNYIKKIFGGNTIKFDPAKQDKSYLATVTGDIGILLQDGRGGKIKISKEMFDSYAFSKNLTYGNALLPMNSSTALEQNFVCPILSSRSRASKIIGYYIYHERYTDEYSTDHEHGYSKTLLLKIGEDILFKQDNVRGMGIQNTKIYGSYKPETDAPFDEFIFKYSLDNFLYSKIQNIQKPKLREIIFKNTGIFEDGINIITEYASGLINYMEDGPILGNLDLLGNKKYSATFRSSSTEKEDVTCFLFT